MIKELFIPEKIGSYYIGSHHICGLDIRTSALFGVAIQAHQKQIAIQKCIDETIEGGMSDTRTTRVSHAIQKVISQLPQPLDITTILSSSVAVIKTLTLPFTSYEQIEVVLGYEIEPALPFPLKDAIIDFLVTDTNKELNQSDILVVAVQKHHVLEHLKPFARLDIMPKCITLDAIALYNLYKHIPQYNRLQGGVVLLDIDATETRIISIRDGRLRLIRNVPLGLAHTNRKDDKALSSFWNNIKFTINSFSAHNGKGMAINKVLLLGTAASISGMEEFASHKLQIPCKLFKIKNVLYDPSISLSQQPCLTLPHATSLGATLGSTGIRPLNLLKDEFKKEKKGLNYAYLLTALGLASVLLGTLFIFSWLYNRSWQNEITNSSKQAIEVLQKRFGSDTITFNQKRPIAQQLNTAVDDAERVVQKRKELWSAFSGPSRASFLNTLYNLFTILDAQSLGLKLSRLKLKNDLLTLKGEVRDFDALTALDTFLDESEFFGTITRGTLQDPSFDIDIEATTAEGE